MEVFQTNVENVKLPEIETANEYVLRSSEAQKLNSSKGETNGVAFAVRPPTYRMIALEAVNAQRTTEARKNREQTHRATGAIIFIIGDDSTDNTNASVFLWKWAAAQAKPSRNAKMHATSHN